MVQVRSAIEPSHLRVIPPSVVIVADVQGLVEVADKVNDEAKGEASLLDRLARVLQDRSELGDLVHDEAFLRIIP